MKPSRRKASAKKPAKKGSGAATRGPAPKYPRHSLEKALRIPRALIEQNAGKPATRDEAVRFAGGTGLNGPWSVEISSGQKYGFLVSDSGTVSLTDRARSVISPQSEADRQSALREAILDAPDFSGVYNYFRGEALPDEPYYANALKDRFKIPADKVPEFQQIFHESLKYAGLLDQTGPQARVLDVGRTEVGGGAGGRAKQSISGRPKSATGASCFVMQPFSGALGSYYDSIFKPAITQAGLVPIRADADIFATGKIMDQIWRGIRDSTVLVAELTSKNPNVFYELGLAHALHKPVVLVSSNEEDVPFDLRHIRVIVYDQTDPFWGEKLIDKVADNIRSAVENPEDAIFRIEDVR
ncbi:hypothetical protein [Amycolatopsis nalaikhensis]|uniref:Uncharacterized protein n=1 Tax=Amycolatopsis nalaikhensis TaxID=715472 RepID=A0ABY8Y1X2_9PSEU|nr:hypothetical protein [Amycolatopsis sp. 2-2]WIV61863.1 hypothetical protein QP939_26265 [Amycolatopsis sp. 2-2]